jgi:hypothetical protein
MDSATGEMVPYIGLTRSHSTHESSNLAVAKPLVNNAICTSKSHRTSKSHSKKPSAPAPAPVTNITYNITNINIGSNNIGSGDRATDPLAAFSFIEIGDKHDKSRCSKSHKHSHHPGCAAGSRRGDYGMYEEDLDAIVVTELDSDDDEDEFDRCCGGYASSTSSWAGY